MPDVEYLPVGIAESHVGRMPNIGLRRRLRKLPAPPIAAKKASDDPLPGINQPRDARIVGRSERGPCGSFYVWRKSARSLRRTHS
jgi:hypothetical protein